MHVLILDDDLRMAALVAALAREGGWTAESASSGTEFQELYRTRAPDAIMLDLQLGASDGIEQMRFLRTAGYLGAIALMSGFDSHVLASAQQLGLSFGLKITGVLEKPARAARVRDVLKEMETSYLKNAASEVFAERTTTTAAAMKDIEPNEIAAALNRGEIELHLQPILSGDGVAVVQLEGLMRWFNPQCGIILPSQFIPIAEREAVVIDQLTSCVIQTALNHYRHLAENGFAIPIAVNISGVNLRSLAFPDRLAELVASTGIPPSALALEITESVAMHGTETVVDVLTRLRLKGFSLAIDDLGTGFSSLQALRQIPFSEIKIDKSFIADLLESRESHAIVTSMIDLARRMNLVCVAEGVENHETAKLLRTLHIDRMQGYFFSRPISLEDLIKWLTEWNAVSRSAESNRSAG